MAVGISMIFEAVGVVLQNALLGAGDARRVMIVAIANQWFLFLPLAYLAGPVWGGGLTAVWLLQVLYRALMSGIFATFWARRKWVHIEI